MPTTRMSVEGEIVWHYGRLSPICGVNKWIRCINDVEMVTCPKCVAELVIKKIK